ncbi:MAG: hypothetical protein J6R59_10415 [Paludibacteraceae bacterium]|nr:hypothetical protein [Paludibacteraceae bacterium]
MNGVEILSSKPIYEVEAYCWLIAVFAGVGLLIGLIVAIVNWIDFGFDSDYIWTIIGCTITGVFIGFLGSVISEHETDTVDYIEYKVTVSEDINFTEFMDKYEVLDQEGKIYIVRERE